MEQAEEGNESGAVCFCDQGSPSFMTCMRLTAYPSPKPSASIDVVLASRKTTRMARGLLWTPPLDQDIQPVLAFTGQQSMQGISLLTYSSRKSIYPVCFGAIAFRVPPTFRSRQSIWIPNASHSMLQRKFLHTVLRRMCVYLEEDLQPRNSIIDNVNARHMSRELHVRHM